MKRLIAMALLGATVLSFAACGGKFTCDACEEEKSGKKYEIEAFGEKMTVCKDCNDEWESALEELEGALGGLEELEGALGDLEDALGDLDF